MGPVVPAKKSMGRRGVDLLQAGKKIEGSPHWSTWKWAMHGSQQLRICGTGQQQEKEKPNVAGEAGLPFAACG